MAEVESLREVSIHLHTLYKRLDSVDDRLTRLTFMLLGSVITNIGGLIAAVVVSL